MIIKNRDEIVKSDLRIHALDIIEAGIHRVLPEECMNTDVKYDPTRDILNIQGREQLLQQLILFMCLLLTDPMLPEILARVQ